MRNNHNFRTGLILGTALGSSNPLGWKLSTSNDMQLVRLADQSQPLDQISQDKSQSQHYVQ